MRSTGSCSNSSDTRRHSSFSANRLRSVQHPHSHHSQFNWVSHCLGTCPACSSSLDVTSTTTFALLFDLFSPSLPRARKEHPDPQERGPGASLDGSGYRTLHFKRLLLWNLSLRVNSRKLIRKERNQIVVRPNCCAVPQSYSTFTHA